MPAVHLAQQPEAQAAEADESMNRDEDTSSEGAQEAIESTRVANEGQMVEVSERMCERPVIELCTIGTQTEAPETASVAVSPRPLALHDNQSQTLIVKHTESATQMSPLAKEPIIKT